MSLSPEVALDATAAMLGISESEVTETDRQEVAVELANMIGSCRETISRAFNQLARDGLVIPRGRSLVVTPALIERADKKKAA